MKVFIYSNDEDNPIKIFIGLHNAFIAALLTYTVLGVVLFLISKIQ